MTLGDELEVQIHIIEITDMTNAHGSISHIHIMPSYNVPNLSRFRIRVACIVYLTVYDVTNVSARAMNSQASLSDVIYTSVSR